MKVVLLQDVKKLGKRGDVVEVADSYGRNVLIRRGLGAEGTKANLNTAEQRRESKEFKSKVAADEAVIMASQLKKVKAVIKVQSGEDGRMKQFGSLERFCIRVLSPKMDPPVIVLVGSTASAATL